MTDADRLRDLQRKAYAVDGSLTDAEATELRALTRHSQTDGTGTDTPATAAEASAAPTAVAATATAGGPDSAASAPAASGTAASGTAASGTEVSARADSGIAPSVSDVTDVVSARRRHGWIAVLATAVAALVIGVGIGWFTFGRPPATSAMTADETAAQAAFEQAGDYDPGSLHFAGSKDGASVWIATKGGGEQLCIALRVNQRRAAQCAPKTDPDGQPAQVLVSFETRLDGEQWMFLAASVEDLTGERRFFLRRTQTVVTTNWQDQYPDSELPAAQAIVDTGVEPSQLRLLGATPAMTVWLANNIPVCMYVVENVDLSVTRQCADEPGGLRLTVGETQFEVTGSSDEDYGLKVQSPAGETE